MVTFDSTDLNNAVSQSGVVHENTNHTSHSNASKLEQGYSISNPLFSSSLVGFWPLQETSGSTAYDFSGNGNNGTANGGAGPSGTGTSSAPLKTTAWKFDGSNDSLTTSLTTVSSPWTIIYWTNGKSASSLGESSSNLSQNTNYSIKFDQYNDSGKLGYSHFGTADYTFSNAPTPENVWAHIVFKNDGSTMYVYVNGVQKGTNGTTIPLPLSTLVTGTYGGAVGGIWALSTALSSSQIQTHYNVVNTKGSLTTQYKPI